MAKYTCNIPWTHDMGTCAPIKGCEDKPNESKEEEALWHYNNSRDHDGLKPLTQLPKGTRFVKEID